MYQQMKQHAVLGMYITVGLFMLQPAADDTATDLVPKFIVSVTPRADFSASNITVVEGRGSHDGNRKEPARSQQAATSASATSLAADGPAGCVAASADSDATSLDSALCALEAAVQLDRVDSGAASGTAPQPQAGVHLLLAAPDCCTMVIREETHMLPSSSRLSAAYLDKYINLSG